MKYAKFANIVKNISYFKMDTFPEFRKDRTLKNQLVRWRGQGNVHMLKKGIYTLNDADRRAPLTALVISNILYPPSYISMESALAFWGLIPERVTQVTALTPRKTSVFKNFYGTFGYRKVKRDIFFGFVSVKDDAGLPILIAMPEKAILDKIYFDPLFEPSEGYFLESLRLQNHQIMSMKRLKAFSKRFSSKKVREGAAVLTSIIRQEKNERHHQKKSGAH